MPSISISIDISQLLRELDSLARFYTPTNVMLIYSGHGFHDVKNMMAGIYTMDVTDNSLGYHDIIRIFKHSTNFYLIHGACRSDRKAINVNYDLLIREFYYFFSIYGVFRGTAALGDPYYGSWMINAFYDQFKDDQCSPTNNEIIILCLLIVARIYNKFIIKEEPSEEERIGMTAKVEVNHNVRELHPNISEITGQSEASVMATKIDIRARENIRERKIRELKCIQKLLKIRILLKEVEQDKSDYDMKINNLQIRRSLTKDKADIRKLIENELRLIELNIAIVRLRDTLRRKVVDQEQRCRDL